MTVSASIVDYAMAIARAGSSAALALSFGATEVAANRVGLFADLTASAEQLAMVVGGVTGPAFRRAGANVLITGAKVQDSTFQIVDDVDNTKSIAFQAASMSSGFQLTLDAGAQAANRTLSVPVLGGNRTLALVDQAQTFTGVQTFGTPIASTSGGTGVNNAGTITNASNTTITGGGTIALGGFTLTVPATGTAALLATANPFTAIQTCTTDIRAARVVGGTIAAPSAASSLFVKNAGGDTFVSGICMQRSSTLDTWSFLVGGDNNYYFGYANNASGADASADFTTIARFTTPAGLSIYGTTSASSSITGSFIVGDGTTVATNVGIGGGNIYAGGNLVLSSAGSVLNVASNMMVFTSPQLTVGNSTTAGYNGLNGPASATQGYFFQSAGVNRWEFYRFGAESGSDSGANISLNAKTDAGAAIDSPISITRAANGFIALSRPVNITPGTTQPALTLTGGTVTASLPAINATQTWNAGGVTFTGIKLNITDTTSAAASLLLDLQVGGTSLFKVSKGGSITAGANAYASNVFLTLNAANNTNRGLQFQTGGLNRWLFYVANNETGANAGADFQLACYDDAGAFLANSISIIRSTQAITMPGATSFTNATDSTSLATGGVICSGGVAVSKRLTLDGATGKTIKYVNGTANAAVAVTFGAVGPTGATAGNQQGWMRVDIGGTDRFVPYW